MVAYLHNQSLTVQDLTVYVTDNETVLSNKGPSFFEPCNHIEADTRVAVFVEHALISGSSKSWSGLVTLMLFLSLLAPDSIGPLRDAAFCRSVKESRSMDELDMTYFRESLFAGQSTQVVVCQIIFDVFCESIKGLNEFPN